MRSADIRTITDEEVAHYRDHGWVRLNQLISSDLASQMLNHAKLIMGSDGGGRHVVQQDIDVAYPWQDHHNVVEEDSSFASVGLSAEMGENAQRLMRRDVGVLLYDNMLAVKIGTQQKSSAPPSAFTDVHQDAPGSLPMDRGGRISFWIALDRVTPAMGLVRFFDRSHQLGSLGNVNPQVGGATMGLTEVYPELCDMILTEPTAFEPGDATAHTMYTVHTAPANTTDKARWTFIVNYIPSDTIYTGAHERVLAQTGALGTLRKIEKAGLVIGEPFGGPMYPKVFG